MKNARKTIGTGLLGLCVLLFGASMLRAQAGAAPLNSAQIVQIGQWSSDTAANAANDATLVDVVKNHYGASLAPRQASLDSDGEKAKEALRMALALRLFHNAVNEFSNPGAATDTANAVKPGPFYCPSADVLERIVSTYVPELPNRADLGPSAYLNALEAQISQLSGERYNEFMLDMAGVLTGDRDLLEQNGIMNAQALERVAALGEGAETVAEGDEEIDAPAPADVDPDEIVVKDEPADGPAMDEPAGSENAPSVEGDLTKLPDEVLREMAESLRGADDEASKARLAAIESELDGRKPAADESRGETVMTAAAPVTEGNETAAVEGDAEPGLPAWWGKDATWAASVRRMLNLSQFYVREAQEEKAAKTAAKNVLLDPVTGKPLSEDEIDAMGAVDEFETGLVNRHDETDAINLGGR